MEIDSSSGAAMEQGDPGQDESDSGSSQGGAAGAAAALGLHLVGRAPSMRSYFAEKRDEEQRNFEQQQQDDGYGAPPPTVGLITVDHPSSLPVVEPKGLFICGCAFGCG